MRQIILIGTILAISMPRVFSQINVITGSYVSLGTMRETLYRGFGLEVSDDDFSQKWSVHRSFGVRMFQPTQESFPFTKYTYETTVYGNSDTSFTANQHINDYIDAWVNLGGLRTFPTKNGQFIVYSSIVCGLNMFTFTVTSDVEPAETTDYSRIFMGLESGIKYNHKFNSKWGLLARTAYTIEFLPNAPILQFISVGIGFSYL